MADKNSLDYVSMVDEKNNIVSISKVEIEKHISAYRGINIRAVPDLLAALESLCADMLRRGVEHSDTESIKAWDTAQDAIAKARW